MAAVLATVTHHSHSKVGTANDAPRGQRTVTSTRVGPAEYFELSSDDGRPTGGERPAALSEPWPQGKVARHVGVGYELVHRPQMGEQLPNIVQFFAAQIPVVAVTMTEPPPPPPQLELFQLYEEEPGGSRPACLAEPRGPQEKVQQCTVEQLADVVPMVQVLDAPGLLGEDVVVEVLRMLDVPAVEQVIAVPKIFLDPTPQRLGDLRQPHMVEQLVHVPTVMSYSSLQQLTADQIVDIPVPGQDGGGARGGLQGFPPGQNSAALHVEQTVDIPVPGRAGEGGRGGLQGFAGQGSTASPSRVGAADGAGQGVFRTFPRKKKSAKQGPHSGSELGADFNPSTLSAHQMPPEQLVDVPVPQVPERLGSRELLQVFRRLQEEEVNLWRVHNALQGVEQMDVGEEEEVVEGSQFLPHFRPRRWCWYVRAGGICPRWWDCTFAHHESELHPDSWQCNVVVGGWCLGPGAWLPWTLPGCPCRFSGAG